MKSTLSLKSQKILLIAILAFHFSSLKAQDEVPEWAIQTPVKKGFVYGVGKSESADLAMAGDKAKMNALRDLTNNYSGKFETYAANCDTLLGDNNKIREIVNTIKIQREAKLKGVEAVDKKVIDAEGKNIVYILLRLDVSTDIKTIKTEIDSDKKLKRKMDENGLLKDLDKM